MHHLLKYSAPKAFGGIQCSVFLFLFLLIGSPRVIGQTNLLTPPAAAPEFPTNQITTVAGASAVATFALNLLPAWDKAATNRFNAHELELEVSPTWKSASASGSTPYLSIGANYWITKYLGVGGDVITFGDGTGSSDLDSGHFFALARKDLGNIAGHLILGGGVENSGPNGAINRNRVDIEFGAGLEYRYSTGIGILVDTRYLYYVTSSNHDHEFLTRVGITLHF